MSKPEPRFRAYLMHALGERLKATEKCLDAAVKDPRSRKAVHRLRTSTRRTLAVMEAAREFLDPARCAHLEKRLQTLAGACGKLRDCDIALQLMDRVGASESNAAKRIRDTRLKRQRVLDKKLRTWANSNTLRKWRHDPPIVSGKSLTWKIHGTVAANARSWLRASLPRLFDAADTAFQSSDPDTFHRFRLVAKELRYTAELFSGAKGVEVLSLLSSLKTLQEKLGKSRDCLIAIKLGRGFARQLQVVHQSSTQDAVEYWKKHFAPLSRKNAKPTLA